MEKHQQRTVHGIGGDGSQKGMDGTSLIRRKKNEQLG